MASDRRNHVPQEKPDSNEAHDTLPDNKVMACGCIAFPRVNGRWGWYWKCGDHAGTFGPTLPVDWAKDSPVSLPDADDRESNLPPAQGDPGWFEWMMLHSPEFVAGHTIGAEAERARIVAAVESLRTYIDTDDGQLLVALDDVLRAIEGKGAEG